MEKQIGNVTVAILEGDITKRKVDAYVIPQFTSCASYGGVGGAIHRAGGTAGLAEFHRRASGTPFSFGDVTETESGGGNAKYHLHAVTVGSDAEREFRVVHTAIVRAIGIAAVNGLQSIAVPALGTGIIGHLTPEQSARAILSAIAALAVNQVPSAVPAMRVEVVIFNDQRACQSFCDALASDDYLSASEESGHKEFDIEEWRRQIASDLRKNEQYGRRN